MNVSSELIACLLFKCSAPIKWSSVVAALMLMASVVVEYLLADVLLSFVVESCSKLLTALLKFQLWFSLL